MGRVSTSSDDAVQGGQQSGGPVNVTGAAGDSSSALGAGDISSSTKTTRIPTDGTFRQERPEAASLEGKIVELLPSDIIFGRGKPFVSHDGNRTLHKVVQKYQEEYKASRRYDKLGIVQEIIQGLQEGRWGTAPARFLKRDGRQHRKEEGKNFWILAPYADIREKVRIMPFYGHTLVRIVLDSPSSFF